MAATNVIPFRPFESVAKQLRRHGRNDLRQAFFGRVHDELAAGHDGKRVAGEVYSAVARSDESTGGAA
jgi:hypothetical protein